MIKSIPVRDLRPGDILSTDGYKVVSALELGSNLGRDVYALEVVSEDGEHTKRDVLGGSVLIHVWVAEVNRVTSMRPDGTTYHHQPR